MTAAPKVTYPPFYGGPVVSPPATTNVIAQPYNPALNKAGSIPSQPSLPAPPSLSSLVVQPANVIAPQYAPTTPARSISPPLNPTGPIQPNPFTSGIGPGTSTSVVFGANPTLYVPNTAGKASQTTMNLPANTTVGGSYPTPSFSPPSSDATATGGALGSATLGYGVSSVASPPASAGVATSTSGSAVPAISSLSTPVVLGGAGLLLALLLL